MMSDKSPRQSMSKKSGKSLKDKRAEKKAKSSRTTASRTQSMPRNAETRPLLTLGVLAHSRKENERRLPIHPMHFQRVDADLRDASTSRPGTANGSASPTRNWRRTWAGCGRGTS